MTDYKHYNFNSDRFCCSNRGQALREAIMRNANYPVHRIELGTYDTPCGRPRVVYMNTTGIVSPDPYTVTPQVPDYIWCSRMPNALSQNGKAPCKNGRLV